MSKIERLIHEIHHRSLWQVLGVYALASWVVWQVVVSLYEGLGLPDWVPATALVLLLIGLPIVLATALVQEGGPRLGGGANVADVTATSSVEGLETTAASLAEPATGGAGESADANRAVESSTPRKPRLKRQLLFTWPRAITGGVLAFAALGLAATGFMGMRVLGVGPAGTLFASGVLDEREPLVLAEFGASTGDSALAMVATRALRVDLEQSPAIRLVQPDRLAAILERMRRPAETPLTENVAREVAVRGGWKGVITGDVASAGGAVIVSARVVAAESGEVLASYRETAPDSSQVVGAVDRVSEKVRSKVGESLRSVRASPALTDITSSSLPAIRRYFDGEEEINRGNRERGLALLREAIALDTAFAMAYRKLASELSNDGQRSAAVQAIDKALTHPGRLTERERLHTEGLKGYITSDDALAIRSYERLLEEDPSDRAALNNLALVYGGRGEFDRAAEYMLRGLATYDSSEPGDAVFTGVFTNAAYYLYNAGNPAAADSVLDRLAYLAPDHPALHWARARAVADRGGYDEARVHLERMRDTRRGSLAWQARYFTNTAALDALQGRITAADRALSERQDIDRRRDQADALLATALHRATLAAWVLGDTARARQLIEDARRETEGRIPLEDIPYAPLADLYARTGQLDSARQVLARFRTEAPGWLRQGSDWIEQTILASVALAEDRPADALPLIREAEEAGATWLGFHAWRGTAFEALGRPDSAIAAYEAYLETPELRRTLFLPEDPAFRGLAHERLGLLYEDAGDRERAARHYAALLELWKDADPELRPRVEAARRALTRLAGEGGP